MARVEYLPTASLDLCQELDQAVQESVASCPSLRAELHGRADAIWTMIDDASKQSREQDGRVTGAVLFAVKTATKNLLADILHARRVESILRQSEHPILN